jgi:HD-like signal output (HDOD) protein
MGTENSLYTILVEKIKKENLVLPTLPEIALKVRQAVDDPDINLNQISDVISQDPALSLGILRVANNAIIGRGIHVETVNQAVTRIGLTQIKSIATAMALEQIFVSDNKMITMYLQRSWSKTINVASVAMCLLTFYLRTNKHSPLTLDTVTLVSLLHNIGVLPILTEAEKYPDIFANYAFLQQAIVKLSSDIGGQVTNAWGFSQDLTDIVLFWSDLSILPTQVHYLDFIRAGAVYHNIFKSETTKERLLESYVNKGIMPDVKFMESADFTTTLAQIKTLFD